MNILELKITNTISNRMQLLLLTFLVTLFSFKSIFSQDTKVIPLSLVKSGRLAFGPFLNGDTLYFCTDAKRKGVKNVSNEVGAGFLDLFSVRIKQKNKLLTKPVRLSDSINTKLNEGPLCISPDGKTLYYSSNLKSSNSSMGDSIREFRLGIFSVSLNNGEWGNSMPFKYNNNSCNFAHPTLNDDGSILVFSSDNIMSKGKTDLFMCRREGNGWGAPISLGDRINTESSETFPFFKGNKLFFASNKPGGIGGLDIYESNFENDTWSEPMLLPTPINSEFDDFCLIVKDSKSGYFSSNRNAGGVDQIFFYERKIPEPLNFIRQEFSLCYTFMDNVMEDTTGLEFEWDFGDGNKAEGLMAEHCYSDSGSYTINFTVHEIIPDRYYKNVATYELNISNKGLPLIVQENKDGESELSVDYSWSNKLFDGHYWLVNNKKVFDDVISIPLLSTDVIRLVVWNKKIEGSEVGIEYVLK